MDDSTFILVFYPGLIDGFADEILHAIYASHIASLHQTAESTSLHLGIAN